MAQAASLGCVPPWRGLAVSGPPARDRVIWYRSIKSSGTLVESILIQNISPCHAAFDFYNICNDNTD